MNSRSKILTILLLFGIIICGIVIFSGKNKKLEVILGERIFIMEVADTEISRIKGLSGHKPLLENEGMIFIFPKPEIHDFWMKDMLFPIDIIWIDENYKIIHIEKSLTPDTYPKTFGAGSPSLYVLEISAGQAQKLDLKAGDKVEFSNK